MTDCCTWTFELHQFQYHYKASKFISKQNTLTWTLRFGYNSSCIIHVCSTYENNNHYGWNISEIVCLFLWPEPLFTIPILYPLYGEATDSNLSEFMIKVDGSAQKGSCIQFITDIFRSKLSCVFQILSIRVFRYEL